MLPAVSLVAPVNLAAAAAAASVCRGAKGSRSLWSGRMKRSPCAGPTTIQNWSRHSLWQIGHWLRDLSSLRAVRHHLLSAPRGLWTAGTPDVRAEHGVAINSWTSRDQPGLVPRGCWAGAEGA